MEIFLEPHYNLELGNCSHGHTLDVEKDITKEMKMTFKIEIYIKS